MAGPGAAARVLPWSKQDRTRARGRDWRPARHRPAPTGLTYGLDAVAMPSFAQVPAWPGNTAAVPLDIVQTTKAGTR